MNDPAPPAPLPPPAVDSGQILQECRRLYLEQLSGLARDAGIRAAPALEALARGAGEFYDDMVALQGRSGFEQAHGLTASRIRLLDHDDLEFSIQLGDMAKRLGERAAPQLARLQLRFMTLLGCAELDRASVPVSPEGVTRGLGEACAELGASMVDLLLLLRNVEGRVMRDLPLVYAQLNELLSRHNVSPAPPPPVRPRETGSAEAPLLRPEGAAAPSGPAPLPQAVPSRPGGGVPPDMFLARLFDALLRDDRLPGGLRPALEELRLPMLRACLLEPAALQDRLHPVRRLFDAMGAAALGLPRSAEASHPVCAAVADIARRLQRQFDRDTTVFEALTAELETLSAQRERRCQELADAYARLGEGQERRDVATQRAHQVLRAVLHRPVPAPIAAFLRRHWVRVLRAVHLTAGEGSPAWREHVSAIDDLLWSVETTQTPAERTRLTTLVPGLLRSLNGGLDRIGLAAEARRAFMDTLFDMQTAALRGAPWTPGAAERLAAEEDAAVEEGGTGDPVLTAVGDGQRILKALRLPGGIPQIGGRESARVKMGDWLEVALPDGTRACGRVNWVSPQLGMPMLVNPEWDYALSVSPAVIDAQLRTGQATVPSGESLFENAARRAQRPAA